MPDNESQIVARASLEAVALSSHADFVRTCAEFRADFFQLPQCFVRTLRTSPSYYVWQRRRKKRINKQKK